MAPRVMRVAAAALIGLAAPVAAEDLAPSGLPVTLIETLLEPLPGTDVRQVVVRVLAPEITSVEMSEALQADLEWACETWGAPAALAAGLPEAEIIVSFMAAPVPRGVAAPDTRQFIERYRVTSGDCIWELF